MDRVGVGDRGARGTGRRSPRGRSQRVTARATRSVAPPVRQDIAEHAFAHALLILALAALARLALSAVVAVVPDETYYWEFSRRLAAGYFDHPPAIAILVRAGVAMFGDTALGVRFWSVVAGWGASLLLVLLARRLGGDRVAFRAAIVIACVPLAAAGLVIATPSTPLMLAAAAGLYALDHAVAERPGSRAAAGWWLVAGVALGIAMLSDYEGALLAIGVLVALLVCPPLRRHLATPAPYLAAMISLVIFSPNIWWNARHHWVSYRFQLAHSLGGVQHHIGLEHLSSFLGGQLAVASPILFVLGAVAVVRSLRSGRPREQLLAAVTGTSMLVLLVSALRGPVEVNWTAASYLPAIVLVALWRGGAVWRRWLVAGCALGAALVVLTYAQALAPILPIRAADDPTARGTGWNQLAMHVEHAARALRDAEQSAAAADDPSAGPGASRRLVTATTATTATTAAPRHTVWIAGNRYQEASELAFHLPSHPITFSLNLSSRRNQYHRWPLFRQRVRAGDDLVLALPAVPPGQSQPVVALLRPRFARVWLAATVELTRGNEVREREEVWVMRHWRAAGSGGPWPPLPARTILRPWATLPAGFTNSTTSP